MSLWYVWHKPSTYLTPTLTLSQNRLKQDSTWLMSPWSSIRCLQYFFWAYGTFKANRAPILHQELHYLQMDRSELPLEPRHLGVPSSAPKMISMPMVCSVQTVHLSCTDTNTVCKRTKMRFHTTHITYKFHRVRPKLFMSLWYVQFKPCTYLVSRLALSPNWPNRAPPDAHHLGVPSFASKMIYEPMVHLMQNKHQSCTDASTVSKLIETIFHMTHVT
jgi:hypothetical protein